ncbi:hypothetical protein EKK58_12915 [Candidatus Dependentiae bacterium]|nr:MAG: hypothetical protein EKK58_12915 [Candidatus Dependentiae bacterium]
MAQTRLRIGEQLALSASPRSIIITDSSSKPAYFAPTTGADTIFFWDDSASNWAHLTIGTNLSITGTTLNASAGAGGYAEIQEEGTPLTARTKFNFVGAGFTAADDAPNTRTNITLDATLDALAAYNTNGLLTQTAADTFTGRTLTGTASRISVTNGNGVSGNPTVDIDAAYVGQTSITTLGTITTGTWDATTIAATAGGTGHETTAVGDLLVGAATNTWNKLTIGANNTFLKSNGTTASWSTIAAADLSDGANIAHINATETISSNWTFSNNIVMNATPSLDTHLVPLGYLNNIIANGLKYHTVRAATTGTLTITARTSTTLTVGGTSFTQDGQTLANGEYFLVKNDTTGVAGAGAADNGVYVVSGVGSSVVLTRAAYMDTAAEVDGHTFAVEDGTTNVGTMWITTSEVTTLGTDSITFTQINSGGSISGSGASNRIAYWTGASTLSSNANFTYDGSVMTLGTSTAATSTILTTQGTTTGGSNYGYTHKNSSGTDVFRVSDNGILTIGGSTPATLQNLGLSRTTGNLLVQATGGTLSLNGTSSSQSAVSVDSGAGGMTIDASTGTTAYHTLLVGSTNKTSTSGNQRYLVVGGGFVVSSSGTNTFAAQEISSTINQTTHTGITRGLYINPTITAAADFRALEITAPATHYSLFSTAGKVRFDLGSDASYDMYYRNTSGELVRLPNGTTGQFLGATTSSAPSWQSVSTTKTIAYIEGFAASTFDLDANIGVVKDRNGTNIEFTLPTDLDSLEVYRNGIRQARTGTSTTRDYSLNAGTNEITFTVATTTDEVLMFVKPS